MKRRNINLKHSSSSSSTTITEYYSIENFVSGRLKNIKDHGKNIIKTTNIPKNSIANRLLKKKLRDFDDISYKQLTTKWQYIYTSFILLVSIISLLMLYYYHKKK